MLPKTRKLSILFTIYMIFTGLIVGVISIFHSLQQYERIQLHNPTFANDLLLGFTAHGILMMVAAAGIFFALRSHPIANRLLYAIVGVILFFTAHRLFMYIFPDIFIKITNSPLQLALTATTAALYIVGVHAISPKLSIKKLTDSSPLILTTAILICTNFVLQLGPIIKTYIENVGSRTNIFTYTEPIMLILFIGCLIFAMQKSYRILYGLLATLAWSGIASFTTTTWQFIHGSAANSTMLQYCSYLIATAVILVSVALVTKRQP